MDRRKEEQLNRLSARPECKIIDDLIVEYKKELGINDNTVLIDRVCAWCGATLGQVKVNKNILTSSSRVTHTVCQSCKDEALTDLKADLSNAKISNMNLNSEGL